jgi:L-threonylcarbamoyladenylate synthase
MNVEEIVRRLKKGGVVEIPTDTVRGLACDYYNKAAEEEIFRIKKRPKEKILSIFVSSIDEVKKIVPVSERQEKFLKKVWPGKITCVLKKDVGGFRIPNDKFVLGILKKFGGPLLQTSANISGESPVGGLPSTVVDLTVWPPKILREGAVSKEEIMRYIEGL